MLEIIANGSNTYPYQKSTLSDLYRLLETYTLDPVFERYGEFVNRTPCWIDGETARKYSGASVIAGNFLSYFYNGAPVNNGYGCRHPECGEDEEDDAGQPCGCCHRYTCPICCPFGEEDLDDPELDLDGRGRQELFDRDGGFADGGELVTVASGDEAGEEERAALLAYNRYLHRYDKEWLEKHPRQEPQSPAR